MLTLIEGVVSSEVVLVVGMVVVAVLVVGMVVVGIVVGGGWVVTRCLLFRFCRFTRDTTHWLLQASVNHECKFGNSFKSG